MSWSKEINYQTRSLTPKPTGIALVFFGCAWLIGGVFFTKYNYELRQNGIHDEAHVIAVERIENSYYPVFVFEDTLGREHTVRSNISSRDYVQGDTVPIVYNPQKPLNAWIDNPISIYFLPGLFCFFGVVFLVVGILVYKLPIFWKAFESQLENDKLSKPK